MLNLAVLIRIVVYLYKQNSMAKVTPIKEKMEIDLTPYVNGDTGEPLLNELKEKTSITVTKDTDRSVVSYSDYSVISTEAVIILNRILSNSDFANVIKMAVVVKTPWSIIFNDNIPHTNATLQKYLEIKSESMYIKLMKRLTNAGVLYQIKGLIFGEVRAIYIINPHICRKRKTFENKILDIFQQFNENSFKINPAKPNLMFNL